MYVFAFICEVDVDGEKTFKELSLHKKKAAERERNEQLENYLKGLKVNEN